MSEVLDCGGDCGSCARCKDRERHEEAAWYANHRGCCNAPAPPDAYDRAAWLSMAAEVAKLREENERLAEALRIANGKIDMGDSLLLKDANYTTHLENARQAAEARAERLAGLLGEARETFCFSERSFNFAPHETLCPKVSEDIHDDQCILARIDAALEEGKRG